MTDACPTLSRAAGRTTSSVIRDLLRLVDQPGMLSMAGGLPAPELLPVARLAEAAERVFAGAGIRALQYAPTEGLAELRALVAASYGAGTGDVLVTTGSQQGLDLLVRTLVDPGDQVVIEAPGYLGAIQSLGAGGADLVTVPGDTDGLRTDHLEDLLRAGARPKLAYVVTDFQNPSGATLSTDRRAHLVALADRYGFVIVGDDPYGDLRFGGVRPPRLCDLTDRAVSLGTVSKVLAPGLRVAWTVAPAWLAGPLARTKQHADLHTSPLNQLIVLDVMGDAAFMAHHLDELRRSYAARAATLCREVATTLGSRLSIDPIEGGMFAWGRLTEGASATDLLPAALAAGVAFVPGDAFAADGSASDRLRLCFTTLSPAELAVAVARIGSVL